MTTRHKVFSEILVQDGVPCGLRGQIIMWSGSFTGRSPGEGTRSPFCAAQASRRNNISLARLTASYFVGAVTHRSSKSLISMRCTTLPLVSFTVAIRAGDKPGGHLLCLSAAGIKFANQLPGTQMCITFKHIH